MIPGCFSKRVECFLEAEGDAGVLPRVFPLQVSVMLGLGLPRSEIPDLLLPVDDHALPKLGK